MSAPVLPDPQEQYMREVFAQLNAELNRTFDLTFFKNTENDFGPDGELVLRSPDGSRWAIRVDNAGVISATAI